MTTELFLSPRQFEILLHIYEHKDNNVQVSARDVKQNKNFYQRVAKLEDCGLITVIRSVGHASLFTLTDLGKEICRTKKIVKFPGFISPIEKVDSELLKKQLDAILKDYEKLENKEDSPIF